MLRLFPSLSLPLQGTFRKGVADHFFFANLLPEGEAREAICMKLGISVVNDFELLRRIGGECAGALVILPEGEPPSHEGRYRPLSHDEIDTAARSAVPARRLMSGPVRFSLAGRQDKWAVYQDADGAFHAPEGAFASSHLIKFDSMRYKASSWNEAFVTYLARGLDMPVVPIVPCDHYAVIERYDRLRDAQGNITRIHQEDFCQALGIASGRKYESDGGPSFGNCLDLVRRMSDDPATDSISLLRWQIANVLLGNADGHAKNLSLVYRDGGCRLAPFYDLVCTAVYEKAGVDRRLAMAVGGEHDPGQIRRMNWERMATDSGMRPGIVFRLLEEMSGRLTKNLLTMRDAFNENHWRNSITDEVRSAIGNRVRRIRTLA